MAPASPAGLASGLGINPTRANLLANHGSNLPGDWKEGRLPSECAFPKWFCQNQSVLFQFGNCRLSLRLAKDLSRFVNSATLAYVVLHHIATDLHFDQLCIGILVEAFEVTVGSIILVIICRRCRLALRMDCGGHFMLAAG